MAQPIQPLRIQKTTPSSSPGKMNAPVQRPLAELGPMERRRNSPSYNQTTKKNMLQENSSPFESSPFASDSPRLYWKQRDSGSPTKANAENRNPLDDFEAPSSVVKRSSIENLKRASRVKNSNMFAREHKGEYDPTSSPLIERPLASGRPFNASVQGGSLGAKGLTQSAIKSPANMRNLFESKSSPIKPQGSPTKSSLSSKSRYAHAQGFDPESSIWSDDEESVLQRQLPPGKSLHRHAKSVTFDVAPPQVNEYEQRTPDPSSVASGSRDGSHDSEDDYDDEEESYERESSIEREDSFDASLEDTEKTPVVLPEDWRFMSPDTANDDLAAKVDDPFDVQGRSPSPSTKVFSAVDARLSPVRTDSAASDGDRRPLPPLPASNTGNAGAKERFDKTALLELTSQSPRREASPPRPASISKAELQGLGGCSMPIEERLRLMMIQDEAGEGIQDARSTLPSQTKHKFLAEQPIESADADMFDGLDDFQTPPRISRESILRKIKGSIHPGATEDEDALGPLASSSSLADLDPDQPLPSTENDEVDEVQVKQENVGDDSDIDVYSIPDLYDQHLQAESYLNAIEKLEEIQKVQEATPQNNEDDESHYSEEISTNEKQPISTTAMVEDDGPPTPRAAIDPAAHIAAQASEKDAQGMSLPKFAALLGDQDFGFGMESFMTPSPNVDDEPAKKSQASHPEALQRPMTPDEQFMTSQFQDEFESALEEPRTPDSVIRHPFEESPAPPSPEIPAPVATIKSSGSKLKTRPSATPADIRAMAEVRRQVSGEVPEVPKIPAKHFGRPSVVAEGDESEDKSDLSVLSGQEDAGKACQHTKRKSSLVTLDVPVEGDDGLGIESEFDRLMEAQKVVPDLFLYTQPSSSQAYGHAEYMAGQGFRPLRDHFADKVSYSQKGYLMRQNTKVIVASSASHESADSASAQPEDPALRGTRSAGNSPRKPSQTKTWTTEPWNGRIRRKSIRQSGGIPSKSAGSGPVPPLPGQESSVSGPLDIVNENEAMVEPEEVGDDGERGRLFVKVVRAKDLDLPLPRGERSHFALTLDNGLHCVTTSWLELGRTAPIGQEFELIVLNDLEFQLTLQTKIEEPKAKPVPESPTKMTKIAKPSAFSKVFSSPRKRKEMELKQQEEAQKADRQRQQDALASRRAQPTAWDLLHKLVDKDGNFARSYICLKDHETQAYGKSVTVDVPCFNEWATEESNSNSYKGKRTGVDAGMQRKAPYKIGKLELQLFFVPKPKGAKDEDMPKSMNACIRELKEAENAKPGHWEGHLSQQGGDCPYWRRRFFTLDGLKLTAYHEATRQPRATINLAKAGKLIDDKSALMRTDASPKKGGRRKSAFAEEEEGYMFVEEGFRIRFSNGEIIDFYADSAAEKDSWMTALSEVVGKDPTKAKSWTDLVLSKRKVAAKPAAPSPTKSTGSAKQAPTIPARSAPPTPAKTFMPKPAPVPQKSPARRSDVAQRRADASKTRSMIF